ncbi:MAG: MBL fold metallo-hydrolase [Spirochaetes bacterium]|nr:MBL fold metallo-hydrolase [Spirochaetota bacterium]
MKKSVKLSLSVIGVLVLIVIIIAGFFMYKLNKEFGKMTVLETREITKGIYSIKDSMGNMYILKSKDKFIAIDAGNDAKNIQNELKKLNIDPEKVGAVLLTHTDSDHVASLGLYKNAKIYISKAEEQMINGKISRMMFMKNELNYPYVTVENNDVLNIAGLKIKGILTPGHTPGSMSWLVNDRYLFTGDTLSLRDGKIAVFSDLFNMDSKTQISSFKYISNLPKAEFIFTAHYGFTANYKKAVENFN